MRRSVVALGIGACGLLAVVVGGCRSHGAGAGDRCDSSADCAIGLECVGQKGREICGMWCAKNSDCPSDSYCDGRQVCMRYVDCAPACGAGTHCETRGGYCVPDPVVDGGPSDGGCTPDFDISGAFTERYNCEEILTGSDAATCVDHDATSNVILSRADGSTTLYDLRSNVDGGFRGRGQLCGSSLQWTAGDMHYSESGTWVFSSTGSFTQPPSVYTYNDGSGLGHCTATGSSSGTPPAPAPIGACL